MRYTKAKEVERLRSYYEKKQAYYGTVSVADHQPEEDRFTALWARFKDQVKQAYTPKLK